MNDNIRTKQISSKKRYDEKAYVKHYDVDTWVYVWKPPPKGCDFKKFYDAYRGPFKLISKMTSHSYRIQLKPGKFDIVHFEHLKQAKAPSNESAVLPYENADDDKVVSEYQETSANHEKQQSASKTLPSGSKVHSRAADRPVIALPIPVPLPEHRRGSRDRTQHVPYQHIPY